MGIDKKLTSVLERSPDKITDYKCPVCGKSLATDEYYLAKEEMRKESVETYKKQTQTVKKAHDKELLALIATHKKEIIDLQISGRSAHKTQLKEMRKTYDNMGKVQQRHFNDLSKKASNEHKKQIFVKDQQVEKLKKEQLRSAKFAVEQAKDAYETKIRKLHAELGERDLQLNRLRGTNDELERQLRDNQPELRGEAGEIALFEILTKEFPDDRFRRQKRGTISGDIIQHIRTAHHTLQTPIQTPIVYDNKESISVTKIDITKAKKYKRIHGTNYVMIVSANLPKRDIPNELYGEKDGILLVHPSIVVEVARQIRNAIIHISRLSESRKDRECKETKLYDYVKSQEFSRTIESAYQVYRKMMDLQTQEEKAHGKLWKQRAILQEQIKQAYIDISSGIDGILQETPMMDDLNEENEAPFGQLDETTLRIKKKRSTSPKD